MYFSIICGFVTLFLATSNYIAPSINLEEEEAEEGEIVEEFKKGSLSTSQYSDEEENTLEDLPTYDNDIYNNIDYSESEKET